MYQLFGLGCEKHHVHVYWLTVNYMMHFQQNNLKKKPIIYRGLISYFHKEMKEKLEFFQQFSWIYIIFWRNWKIQGLTTRNQCCPWQILILGFASLIFGYLIFRLWFAFWCDRKIRPDKYFSLHRSSLSWFRKESIKVSTLERKIKNSLIITFS